jgi:ERF superfamily
MAKAKLLDKDGQPIVQMKNAVAVAEKGAVAQLPDGRTNMLAILARAAADPQCQPEKMRVLLDMHKEIEAEAARMAFFQAFGKMQEELPIINKDGRIEVEGRATAKTVAGRKDRAQLYSTFSNIFKIVKPIARKHGFTIWFEPGIGADERLTMRTHLDHDKGHGISCIIPLPLETSGAKNNVQGVGSSISYGKRYGLIAVCAIISEAPEDKDDDAKAVSATKSEPKADPKITQAQADSLIELMESCGVSREAFLGKYEIAAVADLLAKRHADAVAACKDYAARKGQ